MRASQASPSGVRSVRTRQGSPPALLLTLLGDYWWGRAELLPSAALVELLGEFGVTDAAARAALSRLVGHGLLTSTRSGRNTFYGLTDRALGVLDEGAARIFEFGTEAGEWSGEWSLMVFSIPESDRSVREALRTRLRWLGFAPLYDGVWVSPHDRNAAALAELEELGVRTATAFRARTPPGVAGDRPPQAAWNLAELAERYAAFIAQSRDLLRRLDDGELDTGDALVRRTELMNAWRVFPGLDPDLPSELLPADWPRAEARTLFLDAYERLGALAAERVCAVVAGFAPEIARHVRHHLAPPARHATASGHAHS